MHVSNIAIWFLFFLFSFSFFHTSTRRNDLMEFFDKKEDWEEDQVSCGKWCLNKLFMLKVSFNNSNLRNKIWGINLILKFFITFCIYLLINTVYKHCYIDWSKVNSIKRERCDCKYTRENTSIFAIENGANNRPQLEGSDSPYGTNSNTLIFNNQFSLQNS